MEFGHEFQKIDFKNVIVGQTYKGYALITDIVPQKDKTSKAPLKGNFHYEGLTFPFKLWSGALQDHFNENYEILVGSVFLVQGIISEYNNKIDMDLKTAEIVKNMDKTEFFKKIDYKERLSELQHFVSINTTPRTNEVLNKIFTLVSIDDFIKTWAGSSMHDAQVGGLLNHVMKMLRLAKVMVDSDIRLKEYSEMLYLSIILHDIGKIKEIGVEGEYHDMSFGGHRLFGSEILTLAKEVIIDQFSERFYYNLQAVVVGHHGEYGDAPVTAWAYIVHLIDMLDAHTTHLLDAIENNDVKHSSSGKTVWVGGMNLPFDIE